MERIKPNYYDRFTCIADQVYFHLLSGVEDCSGQRDQPKMEKEISAAGSEGAAEKSQCLYNQKGRRQSDPTG